MYYLSKFFFYDCLQCTFCNFTLDSIPPDIQGLHGGLNNHFVWLLFTSSSIFCVSRLFREILSLFSPSINFFPLSFRLMSECSLREQNLLNANVTSSVARSQNIWKCMACVFRQLSIAPHRFIFPIVDLILLDCFMKMGPNS